MTKCAICGMPTEYMAHFVVYDEEILCISCYERITEFREDLNEC